jgi:integrase
LPISQGHGKFIMADSFPRSKTGWGKKLFEALTRDQVETLLDAFARNGGLLRLAEELRAVDLDLADTLQ